MSSPIQGSKKVDSRFFDDNQADFKELTGVEWHENLAAYFQYLTLKKVSRENYNILEKLKDIEENTYKMYEVFCLVTKQP